MVRFLARPQNGGLRDIVPPTKNQPLGPHSRAYRFRNTLKCPMKGVLVHRPLQRKMDAVWPAQSAPSRASAHFHSRKVVVVRQHIWLKPPIRPTRDASLPCFRNRTKEGSSSVAKLPLEWADMNPQIVDPTCDRHVRGRTHRRGGVASPRLETRLLIRRNDSVVDLARSRPVERLMWTTFVVPVDVARRTSAHRAELHAVGISVRSTFQARVGVNGNRRLNRSPRRATAKPWPPVEPRRWGPTAEADTNSHNRQRTRLPPGP